jgi:hypothetical protein
LPPDRRPRSTCAPRSKQLGIRGRATAEGIIKEKALIEDQLNHSKAERTKLQQEIISMKREAEQTWAAERVENALLRERINDIAAEIARLTVALEGADSPVEALLAGETTGANVPRAVNGERKSAAGGGERKGQPGRSHPRLAIEGIARAGAQLTRAKTVPSSATAPRMADHREGRARGGGIRARKHDIQPALPRIRAATPIAREPAHAIRSLVFGVDRRAGNCHHRGRRRRDRQPAGNRTQGIQRCRNHRRLFQGHVRGGAWCGRWRRSHPQVRRTDPRLYR